MWKLDTLLQAFGGLDRRKDSKLANADKNVKRRVSCMVSEANLKFMFLR